jgi:DNA adenine methylase
LNYSPQSAILSDVNGELISTYEAVRDFPTEIHERLSQLHAIHCKEIYYFQRESVATDAIDAAVRFIYLNRTCWNGLYRVNRQNKFNVPIGTKNSVVFPTDNFAAISTLLKRAQILRSDFEEIINNASCKDLIYVDPPYTVMHNMNGFVKYNQEIFSWSDQIRLRDSLVKARDRGCHVFVSNADHESVRDLYADFSDIYSMPRASVIAGTSNSRGQTSEILVAHHG